MTNLEKQAIEFMKANGHDVGNGDLVVQADEIAFDLAMEEALIRDGWFKFSGDDECVDCKGWDGKSSRCDCGNYRVYWTEDLDVDFRDMQIYATAD